MPIPRFFRRKSKRAGRDHGRRSGRTRCGRGPEALEDRWLLSSVELFVGRRDPDSPRHGVGHVAIVLVPQGPAPDLSNVHEGDRRAPHQIVELPSNQGLLDETHLIARSRLETAYLVAEAIDAVFQEQLGAGPALPEVLADDCLIFLSWRSWFVVRDFPAGDGDDMQLVNETDCRPPLGNVLGAIVEEGSAFGWIDAPVIVELRILRRMRDASPIYLSRADLFYSAYGNDDQVAGDSATRRTELLAQPRSLSKLEVHWVGARGQSQGLIHIVARGRINATGNGHPASMRRLEYRRESRIENVKVSPVIGTMALEARRSINSVTLAAALAATETTTRPLLADSMDFSVGRLPNDIDARSGEALIPAQVTALKHPRSDGGMTRRASESARFDKSRSRSPTAGRELWELRKNRPEHEQENAEAMDGEIAQGDAAALFVLHDWLADRAWTGPCIVAPTRDLSTNYWNTCTAMFLGWSSVSWLWLDAIGHRRLHPRAVLFAIYRPEM